MAKLLSGSTLRKGGSGQFIDLASAQPQLPASPTTSTGYTLVTDSLLRTSYRSSLGNLEFNLGEIWSNIPDGNITLSGTGTGIVFVSSATQSYSTTTGALVVAGGIGIGGALWTNDDINVNGLTIGRGYSAPGINNIVIQGIATEQVSDYPDGQENIAVGYNALQGISSGYKNIAIGRFALSSGTELSNSIAIGDSALQDIGNRHTMPLANITAISQTTPMIITAPAHSIADGTAVVILNTNVAEFEDITYYTKSLTINTLALYTDNILLDPVNGSGYSLYTAGGTVYRILKTNNNIAFGNNSGISLYDGESNFFLGDRVATNLTTGSYNFFIGHEVAGFMTHGNSNISIGGDNLVDGLNNQINIGAVFYYNGGGYLQMATDTGLGVGTPASTSMLVATISAITNSAVCTITISAGSSIASGDKIRITSVVGMTEINGLECYARMVSPSTTLFELYKDEYLDTIPGNSIDTTNYSPYASGGNLYKVQLTGALTVLGGAGISDNLIVGSTATIGGSVYSRDGNPSENNLLYSPNVTMSSVAPTSPRVGEMWIDTVSGGMYIFVDAGASNKIWIQFSTI